MVVIKGEGLTIQDVQRVAVKGDHVELDSDSALRVRDTFDRVQDWGAAEYPIYGVNTGFGELVSMIIPARFKSELQANLLRSHAAGGGPSFPIEAVRAIMLARLNCLLKGHSGASLHAPE